jgi:hypothetical protein
MRYRLRAGRVVARVVVGAGALCLCVAAVSQDGPRWLSDRYPDPFSDGGMIVKAAELLERNPDPSDAEIRSVMNGHLCRCGTYPRIVSAIRRAARTMSEDAA